MYAALVSDENVKKGAERHCRKCHLGLVKDERSGRCDGSPLYGGATYTHDERHMSRNRPPPRPRASKSFHLFVSEHNEAAAGLLREIERP